MKQFGHKSYLTFALICLGSVVTIVPANAGQTEMSDADKAAAEERAQQVLAGGSDAAPTFGTLSKLLTISTDQDDTVATISLGFNRTHQTGKSQPDPQTTQFNFATDSFSVAASAPLGKNGKPSVFDFDKLGDGTKLKFGAVRYSGSIRYRSASSSDSELWRTSSRIDRCMLVRIPYWIEASEDSTKAKVAADAFMVGYNKTRVDHPNWKAGKAIDEQKESTDKVVASLADYLGQKCAHHVGPLNTGPDRIDAELDRTTPASDNGISGLWFLGASGTIARTNYEYLVQTPLGKTDQSKTNYKLQGFGGWVFPSGRASLTGSFSYVRSFQPADEIELCEPNGVGAQLACYTGPLGPPTPVKRYIASGEGRFLFPVGSGPNPPLIGIAPSINYEFKSDAFLIEAPIYFAPDSEGKLNGGIKFAYDTGKKDFAFGLFVGVPFSIFSN